MPTSSRAEWGEGYFLTDARTHRGTSGAPVVMRVPDGAASLGFPLGFHDTLHHMPVVPQAAIASSFGLRFHTPSRIHGRSPRAG